MYNLSTSKAIYAAFGLKFLRFQLFFSGLWTQPTNRPPVRDYDPDTPLASVENLNLNITEMKVRYNTVARLRA